MTNITSRFRRFGMVLATATLCLGLAVPAGAQTQAGTSSAPAAREPSRARPASDRPICVRMHFTGSRLPQKVCMTEREWEAEGGVPTAR